MKKIAIIGGGASGMACAAMLANSISASVTLFERGERLGRKLSATGNGQGNLTNAYMGASFYRSDDLQKVERLLSRFGTEDTVRFFSEMGGIYLPDAKGRMYPAGKQASALTDLLRKTLSRQGVKTVLQAKVSRISRDLTVYYAENQRDRFDAVVLCAGGMAAPNFGTDGNGYALAQSLGHTLVPCTPSLVQLRTDPALVRGLKGIRVDGTVCVLRKGSPVYTTRGDILFTESGISGDACFRASAHAKEGDALSLDLLPDVKEEELYRVLSKNDGEETLLCVVNNGLGRVLYKRANGEKSALVSLLKAFLLPVKGTLGFAYAQVTKGGIPLAETDDDLQSTLCKGLYFAGEILNVDGDCGGYNLQWAFTSAYAVSEGIKGCF